MDACLKNGHDADIQAESAAEWMEVCLFGSIEIMARLFLDTRAKTPPSLEDHDPTDGFHRLAL